MLPSEDQHSMGASRLNMRHPLRLPIKLGLSTAKVDFLRSSSPGIFLLPSSLPSEDFHKGKVKHREMEKEPGDKF